MEKTSNQLWNDVSKWVESNPTAMDAIGDAASAISDTGRQVPMQFVMELVRYNNVLGEGLMHSLVRKLSGIDFADGEYAIPNAVIAGVSRVLKARNPELNIRTSQSKLDERTVPDALL